MNQLWVEVPAGSAGKKLVQEAVAAGKQNGLEVVAVLRLLQVESADKRQEAISDTLLDKNLLGETGSALAARVLTSQAARRDNGLRRRFARTNDWLSADVPGTQSLLEQRLREVATPGLSGLAFIDVAAPGYQNRGDGARTLHIHTQQRFWLYALHAPGVPTAGGLRPG